MFKVKSLVPAVILSLMGMSPALAQGVGELTGQKTLAATIGVYVFPTEGQDEALQSRHEAECYSWAGKTTQSDPFQLQKEVEQAQKQAAGQKEAVAEATQGAGAKGALAGAAAGALIGEIASNHAGGGAAWGAAAGAISARRKARRARQRKEAEIDQQVSSKQRYTAEEIEGFKNAFGVCLEAKKYLVRF